MTDVVFPESEARDRDIGAAWGNYLAHLNVPVPPPGPANQDGETTRVDLLSMLLSKIGKSLNFDFEFTDFSWIIPEFSRNTIADFLHHCR